jgi:hypothetical protein
VSTADSPGWTWNGKRDVYVGLPRNVWKQQIHITKLADWLLNEDNQVRIQQHLNRYLQSYKGRFFETLREQSSTRRFEIFDVSAAEALSVTVPPRAVNKLLESQEIAETVGTICDSLVPGKDTLWTCDIDLLTGDKDALDTGGLLFGLYYKLRGKDIGIGPVTTSKLLAAKFPKVVPIRDTQVAELLGMTWRNDWWTAIRDQFTPKLVQHLDGLTLPDGTGHVSTLRRLDIILWMEANARGISVRQQSKGE